MSAKQTLPNPAATRAAGKYLLHLPYRTTLFCHTPLVCAQFGRDVALVVEEMILQVLSEVEETGSGRLTEIVE